MGKKSRNAGSTKSRVRTCDKPQFQTNVDKVKKAYGLSMGGRSGEMKAMMSKVKEMELDATLDGIDDVVLDCWGGVERGKNRNHSVRNEMGEYNSGKSMKCVIYAEDEVFRDEDTGEVIYKYREGGEGEWNTTIYNVDDKMDNDKLGKLTKGKFKPSTVNSMAQRGCIIRQNNV